MSADGVRTAPTATPSWLAPTRSSSDWRLRLFCFPFAGGNSGMFRSWVQAMPPWVQLCPVELPGRAGRTREPLLNNMTAIVEAAAQGLAPFFDAPFAFFGHSMGALIAFELARHLRRLRRPLPVKLFVAARRAPFLSPAEEERRAVHRLPDREFIDELRRLEGTPAELLEHAELMQLLLPILRMDFEVCYTYAYYPEPPLDCAITAYGGASDSVGHEALASWAAMTRGPFRLQLFPGGHFFLGTERAAVLRNIVAELSAPWALAAAARRL